MAAARATGSALTLLVSGAILSSGCTANSATAIGPALAEHFQLHVGQSVVIASEALQVEFEAVTADSRCGKGETCVWEGDAIVRLRVRRSGLPGEERELHTASSKANAAGVSGYRIRLVSLAPPRISGREIAAAEYVATFTATLGAADDGVIQ